MLSKQATFLNNATGFYSFTAFKNLPSHKFDITLTFVTLAFASFSFAVNAEDIDFVAEGDASLSGHCTVHLKSGYILIGNWHKGHRKGPGTLRPCTISRLELNLRLINFLVKICRNNFFNTMNFFQV